MTERPFDADAETRRAFMEAAGFGDDYCDDEPPARAAESGLDAPFAVTTFKDFAAATKHEQNWTLRTLAPRILAVTANKKASLPWLKLARFGDIRTDKNSLRHDGNVLAITGIEADYDAERMPVAEAVEKLEKAGILGMIYTSPSHTEDAPRWRVLCPTSTELPPDRREKLMGRLNGLFGGILASESWTLSQAYYFGSVNHNPSHVVELIDGTPIDEHDDLDAIWTGKPATTTRTAANGERVAGPADETALLAEITTGTSYHEATVRLLGRWAVRGVPLMEARQWLLDAFDAVPEATRDARWQARRGDADRCLGDIYVKEARQKDQGKRRPEPPPPDAPEGSEPAGDWTNDQPPPDDDDQRPGREGSAPWPVPSLELAAADTLPPPVLPLLDVFPAGWASWIAAAAESKGAPPDYVALALLSAAGALIGNARWANPWDGWQEPPAINAALIGNPSAGKSPALDAVTAPLEELQAADNEDWKERKRKYLTDQTIAAEHKAKWEREVKESLKGGATPGRMPAEADEPEAPQKRRILSTDPTVPKAERMSAGNPRGLVLVRDELAGWIAGMDRFANGAGSDRAFWLQAYGGRPWSPDRVKDGDAEISVPNLTWSIVGGIQPDRLASLLLAGDDDGLAARFLYTWPAPIKPRRPREGLVVPRAREWLGRLRALPWTPPAPLLVPFDRGAQAALQEWREQVAGMEEGSAGLFLSWLGKLPGFAVRLSLIFAHLAWCEHGRGDPPGEVRVADLLRALTFLTDYAVPMARRCFGEAALPEAERDARRLARWLLRRRPIPETLNVRELRRMQDGPGIATPERLRAALDELAGLGVVRPAPARDGAPGRMRADWAVNPAVVGGSHGVG